MELDTAYYLWKIGGMKRNLKKSVEQEVPVVPPVAQFQTTRVQKNRTNVVESGDDARL
jgi:hypothetical protein